MDLICSKTDPEYLDIYKKCSWVRLYYGIVSKVINDNDFKNCAEVGIGYGFHAKEILKNTDVDMLYLIDPHIDYSNDGFPRDVQNFGGFQKLDHNIRTNLLQYSHKYQWFKQPSTTITQQQIPDNTLDLVFIDADHSYQAVQQDLRFWWKKVKNGGWLLGDDYNSCHPGTTQAVDEFAAEFDLQISFLTKPNDEYPIYYFVKKD